VTHDREEAMALGDRIVILRDGAIIAAGAPEELYSQPTSSFAAGFFAAFNVLPVESCRGLPADRARIRWLGREIDLPCEGAIAAAAEVRLLVPRSGLRVGEPAEPGEVPVQGQVLDNVYLGDVAEVTLRLGDGALVVARLTVDDGDAANVGDGITLRISREALRLVALDRLVG
jgi:ABC-type Fe3+/spermidine/putrescine transport system ATPase subunit